MQKKLFALGLLALLVSACAGAAPTPALEPAQPATTTRVAVAPTAPAPTHAAPTLGAALAETQAPPPTATAVALPEISDEFRPTDPATVNLAAGRPQLVEFFAFT